MNKVKLYTSSGISQALSNCFHNNTTKVLFMLENTNMDDILNDIQFYIDILNKNGYGKWGVSDTYGKALLLESKDNNGNIDYLEIKED